MPSRIVVIVAVVAAAFAIGIGARLLLPMWQQTTPIATGEALIGGPFELVDQNGETRRDTDFAGRHMLIYFGYNYCPDVCPTSLQNMTIALESLDRTEADRIEPIYITIDPERDTVAEMKSFAANFHPRLVALTGTPEQVAAAARSYRVYFKKAGEGDDYLVDHSSFIYLMGPDGRYVRHFSHNSNPEEIAAALAELP
ncbi:MAG: SCO family protein [Alphaproteobacteria bacterium]|nr:SCO family protein [Alphaproteobacteria bacterium]